MDVYRETRLYLCTKFALQKQKTNLFPCVKPEWNNIIHIYGIFIYVCATWTSDSRFIFWLKAELEKKTFASHTHKFALHDL